MKERPIPFGIPMARATLDGLKTQTRRIMNPQPIISVDGKDIRWYAREGKNPRGLRLYEGGADPIPRFKQLVTAFSPYGVVGDRLWGREPWRVSKRHDDRPPRDIKPRSCTVFYAAGGSRANHGEPPAWMDDPEGWPATPEIWPAWVGRYRHAKFMPRWASRITLEITGVRAERLQDISEADAIAEGLLRQGDGWRGSADLPWCASPIGAYRELWKAINGPESWTANPWVWVIEFKHLTTAHNQL